MANRYWVSGGTGAWNSTTNWSSTDGGASGASVPGSADDVFVNANSGTSPTLTLSGTLLCLSLDFTGSITPTIAGSSGALNISGSLTRIAAMTWTYSGTLNFKSTSTGKTITNASGSYAGPITFDGVGGGWTFQDNITVIGNITLTNGTLNTNGKTVNCTSFSSSNSNIRTLTLGASSITCTSSWLFFSTTNLTLTANTATITMTSATSNSVDGGGLTYNNFVLSGTTTNFAGSSTFNSITLSAGKTLRLTAGTTQTLTTLICNGTVANPSTIKSLTAGSAATIALPSGRSFIRHTSIQDITISGATSVTSIGGTNVSGNTGITFVTKFEMGRIKNDGSFNWYSTTTGTVDKVSG